MTAGEKGFLLLSSKLGNPKRKPLTIPQLRELSYRVNQMDKPAEDRELTAEDLRRLGYGEKQAEHIAALLYEETVLSWYVQAGKKQGCEPITRISPDFPRQLRERLGLECPGSLWVKGNLDLLRLPCVGLVGSRELRLENRRFAETVGREAARQGYALVSGNAKGADQAAQDACLAAGGYVISFVADCLQDKPYDPHVLYLSEDGFDEPFTSWRALSRNHLIHSMGKCTFVAQSNLETGGSWDGTIYNLKRECSPVFCFRDGSDGINALAGRGATLISMVDLQDFEALQTQELSFF